MSNKFRNAAYQRGNHGLSSRESLRNNDRLRLAQRRHDNEIQGSYHLRKILSVTRDNDGGGASRERSADLFI